MRGDMAKKIIERPRGGGGPRKPGRRRPLETLPFRGSMSMHRGGTKWLSDNIAPLVRFLESRIGRPWNDVYSELRSVLSPTSVIQRHVFQHLEHMVERHPDVRGEKFYYHDRRYEITNRLYVCPETGVLCAPPHWRRRRVRRKQDGDVQPAKPGGGSSRPQRRSWRRGYGAAARLR